MLNFKEVIANSISKATEIESHELLSYIEVPPSKEMGDYAFPCFRLAKTLKKAPPVIASELKEKIEIDENIISKIDIAGGYLNFYVNEISLIKSVLSKVDSEKDSFGKSEIGKDQTRWFQMMSLK